MASAILLLLTQDFVKRLGQATVRNVTPALRGKTIIPKVYITLKPTVNDPQRLTIKSGLHMLTFDSMLSVRAGKRMQVKLEKIGSF